MRRLLTSYVSYRIESKLAAWILGHVLNAKHIQKWNLFEGNIWFHASLVVFL